MPLRWIGLLLVVAAAPAYAQDPDDLCEEPTEGVDVTFPASGSRGVPIDAVIRVRYGTIPDDRPDAVRLFELGRDGSGSTIIAGEVDGSFQRVGQELIFTPFIDLLPTTEYRISARDPLTTNFEADFTTGTARDQGPPTFDGLTSIGSEPFEQPACGAPDGGYRITASFDPAVDDGPAEDVEYVLFQTRGPDIEGPVVRTRVRGLTFAAFLLPKESSTSPICLAAIAYDGQGTSTGVGRERCVDPVQGNFFASCSAAGGARATHGALACFGTLVVALLLSRRLGRRPRR